MVDVAMTVHLTINGRLRELVHSLIA